MHLRTGSLRAGRSKKRSDEIRQIYKESHEIYGAPKIIEEIRQKGEAIEKKTRNVDKPFPD